MGSFDLIVRAPPRASLAHDVRDDDDVPVTRPLSSGHITTIVTDHITVTASHGGEQKLMTPII